MTVLPQIPTLPSANLRLPPQLEGLARIAYNLYWSWNPATRSLFHRIDDAAWRWHRNPIPLLHIQRDWTPFIENPDFLTEYQIQLDRFDRYMENGADHWFQRRHGKDLSGPIAYFCAEYGLHESIGTYSGGLGVLAGDHCKSASDMALPFIAVGLLYRHGYFRQTIDADGHQEHAYPNYDPDRLPILPVVDTNGMPLRVPVELPGRTVQVGVWLVQVGRVPLLLLDTDLPENREEDRPITHILYVRGREMRLHQEIVLGVGGVRALRALGISPATWHLNEGHSAFMLVERIRERIASGAPLDEALASTRASSVFTIHTPVPAGNERFETDLVRRLSAPLLEPQQIDVETILERGRGPDGDPGQFDMTAFSLRLTRAANGVSALHARTANETWSALIDHPIIGITNGVHPPSWLDLPIRQLYQDLGGEVEAMDTERTGPGFWERISEIPDRRLWEAHRRQKLELAYFARGRLRTQFARHGEAPATLEELETALDPEILTIGFARRFATYKRAELLFADEERLAQILWNPDRPIQIVFAGKAHPADRPGQHVIQQIFARTRSPRLRGRVYIVEDYDIRIGRYLVQGVDVWLNNPRRPLEASGTSGMKAAMNGIVNCSVLDGWWDEGYNGHNGWAIGGRETNPDEGAQDWADVQDLYRILEQEIGPRYYERDEEGLPRAWLALMKASISSTIWRFSTTRMLEDYIERLYLPTEPHAEGVPPADLATVPQTATA